MRARLCWLGLWGMSGCAALIGEDPSPVATGPEVDVPADESSSSSGQTGSGSSGARSGSSSSSSGGPRWSSSGQAVDAGSDASTPARFTAIAAGVQSSCGVLRNGTLACWGGATGTGPVADDDTDLPQLVLDAPNGTALQHVVAVGLGNETTCAVQSTPNRVVCWGSAAHGRTGGGTDQSSDAVVSVVGSDLLPIGDWLASPGALAVGTQHVCALRTGGQVACWGKMAYGALGTNDDGVYRAHAGNVVGATGTGTLSGITQLALGDEFSCALGGDGKVYCWGNRFRGALGDGQGSGESFVPAAVTTESGVLSGVTQISAGGTHACALAAGQIYCWGRNAHKELGVFVEGVAPSESRVARPVRGSETGAPLASMRAVAAGANHTCAVDGAGTALCWGFNNFFQLGNGEAEPEDVAVPRPVLQAVAPAQSLVGIVAVGAGRYHSVALDEHGLGWAWGDRALGSTEDESNFALPVLVDRLPLESP